MAIINYEELYDVIEKNIGEFEQAKEINLYKFFSAVEPIFSAHGFREADNIKSGIENILIVKMDNVGDFVLASPAIREIRMNYPYANITLVVNPKVYNIAELCPYVNEVIATDINLYSTNLADLFRDAVKFAKEKLWNKHFTLAFDLRYFKTEKWSHMFTVYLSGAKKRIGYILETEKVYTEEKLDVNKDFSRFFYTHCCSNPQEVISDCARNLYLLSAYGLKISNTNLELWFDFSDKLVADMLLEDFAPGKIKVIVGLGASTLSRKYPVEKYLQAFKKIIKKGAALIILGGPFEAEDAKFLQDNLPPDSVRNLVDEPTGWRTDSAIISQADMYIGNMTGICDVASAAHIPIICLSRVAKDIKKFLPTVPAECEVYFPWQTKTILLQPDHQLGECANNHNWRGCSEDTSHCIAQINPEEIVSAYEKIVSFMDIKETECPQTFRSLKQDFLLYNKN